MSVYKRGDVWWVTVTVNGRRTRFSAGSGATKQQAQELEAKLRADHHAGRVGRAPSRTVEDALLQWFKTDARTLKSKARALLSFIKGIPLADAPSAAARAKESWLAEGLKPATINRRLAILRRICNLAHEEWGWLDAPVASKIKLLAGEEARHLYLTAEQIQQLMDACTRPEVADMILLAASTGLREGELLGLCPENVTDDAIILTSKTKSGKPRRIPLPEGAADLARRVIAAGLPYNQLRTGFEAARAKAGMTHIRFHDLRHSYASLLLQGGASLLAVRDILGHSTLAVTSRYAHLADGHLKGVVVDLPRKSQFGHRDK